MAAVTANVLGRSPRGQQWCRAIGLRFVNFRDRVPDIHGGGGAAGSIQNKLEPASNNNGLPCQSAVAVAIGAKGLSGALSNAADPELVLPMVAAARHRPEQAIQRAVFDHLRQRGAPGTFAFHPPNGGWRSVIEAAILKGLGVVAGTPDVIVLKGGATYALELKAEGGRLSETQRATHAAMIAAGAVVGVAHGIDQAIAWLEGHKLLRGTMTTPTRSRP